MIRFVAAASLAAALAACDPTPAPPSEWSASPPPPAQSSPPSAPLPPSRVPPPRVVPSDAATLEAGAADRARGVVVQPDAKASFEPVVHGDQVVLRASDAGGPLLTIDLRYDQETGSVLQITNPLHQFLSYGAIVEFADKSGERPTVCPIGPGLTSTKKWPQQVFRIALHDFTVADKAGPCR